jgi:hypothetical protein
MISSTYRRVEASSESALTSSKSPPTEKQRSAPPQITTPSTESSASHSAHSCGSCRVMAMVKGFWGLSCAMRSSIKRSCRSM